MTTSPLRSLVIFICLAFGTSWAIAFALYLAGGFVSVGPWLPVVLFAYMCGPAIAGITCVLLFDRSRWKDALGIMRPNWKEMPWAWIAGILLLGGALLITLTIPGYKFISPMDSLANQIEVASETMSEQDLSLARTQLQMPFLGIILLGMSLLIGPLINAFLTLSEELGWRGYLWHVLKEQGFWSATCITGLLWGLWHMPIIWLGHNYPDAPILGSALFVLLCLLMSPVYSWLRVTTKSVWGPGLFHGTTNSAASYFIMLQDPQDQPWLGLLGIGGFIAATLSAVLIWLASRRNRPELSIAH